MPGTEARIRAFLAEIAGRWRRLAWLRFGARTGVVLGALWAVAIAVWLAGARASLAREAWLVAAVASLTAIACGLAGSVQSVLSRSTRPQKPPASNSECLCRGALLRQQHPR